MSAPLSRAGGEAVAIVGAGLGGLTAALALLRRGWRVRVYEQAPELTEVGAGISLSPGVGRALAFLGVGPELLAASLPTPAVAFAHYRTGELLAGAFERGTPLDRGFETARHIHRADLHAILLAAVRACDADAVQIGKKLVDVASEDAAVALRFDDGVSAKADMLIAADGARSTVRRLLFDDTKPEFAGQVAFRCLVPREAAAPFMTNGAVVSVGPSRIFHRYAIRRGALVNVIGIARSDHWQAEGWGVAATVQAFLDEYEGFHPDVLGLIRAAPADTLIKWGLFVRPPIKVWSRGRVALLGDAAHPILPFLGLGAALAIEDGVVLARALDATPDVERAFAAYQAARMARVEQVRVQTIRQGEIIQSSDPDREGVAKSPSQDGRLFDYDPNGAAIHV
jgi:salicylate hydroxylase